MIDLVIFDWGPMTLDPTKAKAVSILEVPVCPVEGRLRRKDKTWTLVFTSSSLPITTNIDLLIFPSLTYIFKDERHQKGLFSAP
jgi:hypothetical protein